MIPVRLSRRQIESIYVFSSFIEPHRDARMHLKTEVKFVRSISQPATDYHTTKVSSYPHYDHGCRSDVTASAIFTHPLQILVDGTFPSRTKNENCFALKLSLTRTTSIFTFHVVDFQSPVLPRLTKFAWCLRRGQTQYITNYII